MISREEAIQILDNERPCCGEKVTYSECERCEAYDMAIEALEKQIPQKPTIWGDGYADGVLIYDMWDCPNCEKSYEIDYDHYDHCPNCGQAIDWSDIE